MLELLLWLTIVLVNYSNRNVFFINMYIKYKDSYVITFKLLFFTFSFMIFYASFLFTAEETFNIFYHFFIFTLKTNKTYFKISNFSPRKPNR